MSVRHSRRSPPIHQRTCLAPSCRFHSCKKQRVSYPLSRGAWPFDQPLTDFPATHNISVFMKKKAIEHVEHKTYIEQVYCCRNGFPYHAYKEENHIQKQEYDC